MLWRQGIVYLFIALVLGVLGGFIHSLLGSIFRHLPGALVLRWIKDFVFCVVSAVLLLLLMNHFDYGRFRLSPCFAYFIGWWQYRKIAGPMVDQGINMFFTVVSKFAIIIKSKVQRRTSREAGHRN